MAIAIALGTRGLAGSSCGCRVAERTWVTLQSGCHGMAEHGESCLLIAVLDSTSGRFKLVSAVLALWQFARTVATQSPWPAGKGPGDSLMANWSARACRQAEAPQCTPHAVATLRHRVPSSGPRPGGDSDCGKQKELKLTKHLAGGPLLSRVDLPITLTYVEQPASTSYALDIEVRVYKENHEPRYHVVPGPRFRDWIVSRSSNSIVSGTKRAGLNSESIVSGTGPDIGGSFRRSAGRRGRFR
jgi:hypothetical protein